MFSKKPMSSSQKIWIYTMFKLHVCTTLYSLDSFRNCVNISRSVLVRFCGDMWVCGCVCPCQTHCLLPHERTQSWLGWGHSRNGWNSSIYVQRMLVKARRESHTHTLVLTLCSTDKPGSPENGFSSKRTPSKAIKSEKTAAATRAQIQKAQSNNCSPQTQKELINTQKMNTQTVLLFITVYINLHLKDQGEFTKLFTDSICVQTSLFILPILMH